MNKPFEISLLLKLGIDIENERILYGIYMVKKWSGLYVIALTRSISSRCEREMGA